MPTAPKKKFALKAKSPAQQKTKPKQAAKPATKSSAPARPAPISAPAALPAPAPAPFAAASTVPFAFTDGTRAIHHSHSSEDRPVDVLRSLIQRHLVSTLARHASSATPRDWWIATALAVRDTIHERMIATQAVHNAQNVRRIYYFSLEYLMGRLFGNNLLATGLLDAAKIALESLGLYF